MALNFTRDESNVACHLTFDEITVPAALGEDPLEGSSP
jgi:hypothetical protein